MSDMHNGTQRTKDMGDIVDIGSGFRFGCRLFLVSTPELPSNIPKNPLLRAIRALLKGPWKVLVVSTQGTRPAPRSLQEEV